MLKVIKDILTFIFLYGGFALVIAAAWSVHPSLGYLVAGCLAVFIGISIYRSEE